MVNFFYKALARLAADKRMALLSITDKETIDWYKTINLLTISLYVGTETRMIDAPSG